MPEDQAPADKGGNANIEKRGVGADLLHYGADLATIGTFLISQRPGASGGDPAPSDRPDATPAPPAPTQEGSDE